jgi:hypothetical protein
MARRKVSSKRIEKRRRKKRRRTVTRRLEVDQMRLEELRSDTPVDLKVLRHERSDVLTTSIRHKAVQEILRQKTPRKDSLIEVDNAPRLPQLRHVRINERHSSLAVEPPHNRLFVLELVRLGLLLIPSLPPSRFELRRSFLRVGDFLEAAEGEEFGAVFTVGGRFMRGERGKASTRRRERGERRTKEGRKSAQVRRRRVKKGKRTEQ